MLSDFLLLQGFNYVLIQFEMIIQASAPVIPLPSVPSSFVEIRHECRQDCQTETNYFTGDMFACVYTLNTRESRIPTLRWFPRQVGNQCSDGADVGNDSKHDGEHGQPQSLARCSVGPLKIPLSCCLVGLRIQGESEINIKRQQGEQYFSSFAFVLYDKNFPLPTYSHEQG